jgi:hypothetical protein
MSRADAEGSDVDAAMFDLWWDRQKGSAALQLPTGQSAERLAWAREGRLLRPQGLLIPLDVAKVLHEALQRGVKEIALR